jgi:hypothetical protein
MEEDDDDEYSHEVHSSWDLRSSQFLRIRFAVTHNSACFPEEA